MSAGHDDTLARFRAWKSLADEGSSALLEATEGVAEPTAQLVSALRKTWPAEQVAAALELARGRVKAREKFPDQPAIWCDVAGIEQATSADVASWKARRFKDLGSDQVLDLCCGIGGDAMALNQTAEVLGVDLDPLRTWMTAQNAGCAVETADILEVPVDDAIVHLDPARREETSGRRTWQLDSYRPPWDTLVDLISRTRAAACKLGPGIPLPLEGAPSESELEFIQEGGRLVQAVLWTGAFAEGGALRRATMLPSGESLVGSVEPIPQDDDGVLDSGMYLLEPRVALERSGLIGHAVQGLPSTAYEVAPGLGLMVAEQPSSNTWFIDWPILAVLPLRERPLKSWLREHDGGIVVMRTRGRAVDVDQWARALRGKGSTEYVIFAVRLGVQTRAIVCQSLA